MRHAATVGLTTTSGLLRRPVLRQNTLTLRPGFPHSDEILITVRHERSYRGVLYKSKHKVEYAVFDPEEAGDGKIEKFQILIGTHVEELAIL